MYQPMTEMMRECQDAITECMEAMLVELKRDHSLVHWQITPISRYKLTTESRPRRSERPKRSIQELRHHGQDAP